MLVGQLCNRLLVTATPQTTARQAARLMRERRVGSLLVEDGSDTPVGVVTDRDLATQVVAESLDPDATTIKDLVARSPETIREDCTIPDALAKMAEVSCRRLPVVDERDGLVGIVSLDDILQYLGDQLHSVGQLLGSRGPEVMHR